MSAYAAPMIEDMALAIACDHKPILQVFAPGISKIDAWKVIALTLRIMKLDEGVASMDNEKKPDEHKIITTEDLGFTYWGNSSATTKEAAESEANESLISLGIAPDKIVAVNHGAMWKVWVKYEEKEDSE